MNLVLKPALIDGNYNKRLVVSIVNFLFINSFIAYAQNILFNKII